MTVISENLTFANNGALFQFHYEGQMAVFHLKDRDIAESLRKINKTITMPNSNFKVGRSAIRIIFFSFEVANEPIYYSI